MISHKHKCIFIHIPKAAGTSIESFFLDDLGLDFEDKHSLIIGISTNLYLAPRVVSHLTANDMLNQHYISNDLFDSYYKFSIVRNPISRLYSTYKYWGFEPVISFDTFIKTVLKKLIHSEKYGFFLKSQTDFLYNDVKEKNLMDFTGKFEDIKSDFKIISQTLNFNKFDLPYKNKAKEKASFLRGLKRIYDNNELITKVNFFHSKSKDLSDDSKKVILEYYAEDFDNFNYKLI